MALNQFEERQSMSLQKLLRPVAFAGLLFILLTDWRRQPCWSVGETMRMISGPDVSTQVHWSRTGWLPPMLKTSQLAHWLDQPFPSPIRNWWLSIRQRTGEPRRTQLVKSGCQARV